MLAVLLKILTVLGIVLLCLLGLLILLILLVLFLPVSYRIFGRREASTGHMEAWAKMRWLFGIFRADYRYPSPGRFIVKAAGITVYDSGRQKPEKVSEEKKPEENKTEKNVAAETGQKAEEFEVLETRQKEEEAESSETRHREEEAEVSETRQKAEEAEVLETRHREVEAEVSKTRQKEEEAESSETRQKAEEAKSSETRHRAEEAEETKTRHKTEEAEASETGQKAEDTEESEEPRLNWTDRICQRLRDAYEKIKYTILKICGKIKDILEHADYYKELLKEEETHLLFGDARIRILKVIKSIRPRKVKADIRFGTGSPDTTGYALGIYGMLSAFLGKNINVTPDFEEAVLEGEIFLAGRITAFILLMNIGQLFLDRRLRTFIKRLKREDT